MNNKYGFILLLFILSFAGMQTQAQDIHFSQFNAAPMLLNPAKTGFIPHTIRYSGIHRNQWFRFAPYYSNVLSVEWNPKHEKYIPENDKLGLGLLVITDKSGDEFGFSTNKFLGSLAYNKSVGPLFIGLGLQAGLYSRKINGLEHTFPDMFTGDPDHLDYTQADPLSYEPVRYFDGNAGLLVNYYLSSDGSNIYFGATLNHFQNPSLETDIIPAFVQNWSTDMGKAPANITYNLGSKIVIGYNYMSLSPQMIYRRQFGAQQFIFGTDIEYFTSHPRAVIKKELIAGTYYRFGHDIILMVGSRISDYTFKLSYEVNHTALTNAASGIIGGFEISFVYAPSPSIY